MKGHIMRSKAILVALLAFAFVAQAAPVSERQARLAARAWAASSGRFGARIGSSVERIREFALTNGASFFSVKMDGGGAVIVSGDSEDSPIVAMSSADISNPEAGSPLRLLLESDMSVRKNATRSAAEARKARRLWLRLIQAGEALDQDGGRVPASIVEPADLRVPVLVESKWNQNGHGEDYYTPNHYVCGCVATAMAQIMRYHRYPVDSIAPFSNPSCSVNGVTTTQTALGGVYDWDNMPLVPASSMSDVEKEAIGHLTYDCGVAVGMEWSARMSGAITTKVGDALKLRFNYASAKVVDITESISDLSVNESSREKTIYASLDAGFPVQLGIHDATGSNGHSVVADGYGYIGDVSYVHLNMGWSGLGDIWYHLPDVTYVATSGGMAYDADVITACIYNIFPTQTGVVISGRTLDDAGEVVAGASVSVYRAGEGEPFTNVTSSASGVYAVIVPENAEYAISAVYESFLGETEVAVGDENAWGRNVVLSAPSVRVIGPDGVSTNSTLDRALREAASIDDPTIEIFAPTTLKRDVTVADDCCVVAVPELAGSVQVVRKGGAKITVDGAAVVFSNVLFSAASDNPVSSVNGGVAAFAGETSIGEMLVVTADAPGGFAIAGDIVGGIQVNVEGAMTDGAVFGVAMCDLATAQANAAKIVNGEDSSLGGEAFEGAETGEVLLRWAEVSVDPSAAVAAYQDASGDWHYVRSFDDALVGDATKIVLKKSSSMSKKFESAADVEISSENGVALDVKPGAQFVANSGANVSFSDIVARGGTLSASFVVVNGGTVEMKSGAVFEGISVANVSSSYGLVVAMSGKFIMNFESAIRGCNADGSESGASGGGVYVCEGATFEMKGGEITGCRAQNLGGGVFAAKGSSVLLSGDATISGNTTSGVGAEDDLCYKDGTVYVAGTMTGRVGVSGNPVNLNNDGRKLAEKTARASTADLDAAAGVFFSTVDDDKVRTAVVDGNSLKWRVEDAPVGPFPVTPAYDDEGFITNAVARVIRADGTKDYWESVSDAFLSIVGDAEIEILDDDFFYTTMEVTNNVVLRSAKDSPNGSEYIAALYRTDTCRISVAAGASLTVESVYISGDSYIDPDTGDVIGGTDRLFDVNGGKLRLSDVFIFGVYGKSDRAAAAVVVYGGGTATLDDGTIICYCENAFVDTDVNAGAAAGIVAEDEGTAVYLRDCRIANCHSVKTGGVFIGNKASIYISGNASVVDNSCEDDNSCGNMVVADGGNLYLDGALTGFVGYREGVGGDTNVFGSVTCSLTEEVTASATNFVHDVTRARGSVDGANLVWNPAGRVAVVKPAPAGTTFVYDGTSHVVFADGDGYTVSGAEGTDVGEYHAVVRLEPGCVWDDGTADVVTCDWAITPAALTIVASDASKVEGADDPEYLTSFGTGSGLLGYSVQGLVDGDTATNVVRVWLQRESGEEQGDYIIYLLRFTLKDNNYSFDSEKSFTTGVFTIEPSDDELLPPISEEATLDEILAALNNSGVSDPRVIAVVEDYYNANPEGARAAYNKFRTWAKTSVDGGARAVCRSEKAWVSYEFGVSELFENTPTVTFTSIEIEDPSIAAMRVRLVVKDGDVEKDVDSDSVAALFEMSTDLKVWSGDLTAEANEDGSYTVKPNDPTLDRAVIRLRY